jgi:hypothetical protein
LDSEADERRKLTLLLTHQQEQFFSKSETVEAKKVGKGKICCGKRFLETENRALCKMTQ